MHSIGPVPYLTLPALVVLCTGKVVTDLAQRLSPPSLTPLSSNLAIQTAWVFYSVGKEKKSHVPGAPWNSLPSDLLAS